MGLTGLNTALSGLRLAQQQISVISGNVANASTPGFTRKILPQESQAIEGVTIGVLADTIIRNVDLNLTRDLWTQESRVGALDVKETYLNRISEFHGPPDKELSVAAEIARLRDSFSALSDNPSDSFLLSAVVNQATDTANKINDLADFINTLRNDAQDEMRATVTRINDLLGQIAELNKQVKSNANFGRSTALLEDQRDTAVQELSGLIDISFFKQGDGVLVVQTNQGIEMVSDKATLLTFSPLPVSASTYYPASVAGVYVGDPTKPGSVDITARSPGGKLGGLIELRDVTFPKQMAQLDEMAHKLALRLEAQGLRLFTDQTGNVPSDAPPDPTTNPPTAVAYVGFAAKMRVNSAILNNHSLVQSGTYGATIEEGSDAVIRRVIEFGFGDVDYQLIGNTNASTSVDLLNTGGADLQNWLGLISSNTIEGTRDLSAFLSINDFVTAAGGALDDPNDQFQITFSEPRTGLGPITITVDLSVADGFAGATALDQLVAHINNEIAGAGLPAGLTATASVGADGQLVIDSNGTMQIDGSFGATGIGPDGLALLGFAEGTYAPEDPYFDVQVGHDDPVRIYIEPGDTSVELLAKLAAVPGLAVDTTNFAIDGFLRMRAGDDFDNPDYGGDIHIFGGPFETSGAGLAAPPALAGRTSIVDGVGIASALFGTYSVSGGVVNNLSPISDVGYQSETAVGSGVFVPFRETYLGPDTGADTLVTGAGAIIGYSQKVVNEQSQELIITQNRRTDESTLRETLQKRLLDESGVNIDEELGNLIFVQNAYAASARVITAVDQMFQDLLDAVR